MTSAAPVTPPADDKDWTWVLSRPCPDCGYDASGLAPEQTGTAVRDAATELVAALDRPGATTRPEPEVWSALEYACHVRDVCRVFGERLGRMLAEDEPRFPNWDQDATALEDAYWEQDPARVADELRADAASLAAAWDAVPAGAWERRGVRSNGSEFTVRTLGQYLVHDLVHHVHDVSQAGAATSQP